MLANLQKRSQDTATGFWQSRLDMKHVSCLRNASWRGPGTLLLQSLPSNICRGSTFRAFEISLQRSVWHTKSIAKRVDEASREVKNSEKVSSFRRSADAADVRSFPNSLQLHPATDV